MQLTLRIFHNSSFMTFLDKLQLPLIGCDYIMLFYTMTANLFKLKRKLKLHREELHFVLRQSCYLVWVVTHSGTQAELEFLFLLLQSLKFWDHKPFFLVTGS